MAASTRASQSSKDRVKGQEQQNVSTEAPDALGVKAGPVRALLQLVLVFAAWKTLLLIIAYASPGPGYDTSSQLLPIFEQSHDIEGNAASSPTLRYLVQRLTLRLTRWDAVYFASAADRGHVFEQEWAFSPFLATLTSNLTRLINSAVNSFSSHNASNSIPESFVSVVVTGIVVSHIAHFIAVGLVFGICFTILPTSRTRACSIAFTAAVLHIVSPAGLFLSAPYGESLYAALTFAGVWSHATAFSALDTDNSHTLFPSKITGGSISLRSAFFLILSSIFFGLGSLIRGNGLLNGLVFVFDMAPYFCSLPSMLRRRDIHDLLTTATIGFAGAILGLIYASGQLEPYLRHCTNGNDRPWCSTFPPSIYTFVQSHYWNNGFLRYWTLSNLPLFLLAAPMLLVMLGSSYIAVFRSEILASIIQSPPHEDVTRTVAVKSADNVADATRTLHRQQEYRFKRVFASLALPQLVFTLLAFTSFHVQIVNRVSSGYALWYMTLAIVLHSPGHVSLSIKANPDGKRTSKSATVSIHDRAIQAFVSPRTVRNLVRGMVMYAVIQGGLYASFLPPA